MELSYSPEQQLLGAMLLGECRLFIERARDASVDAYLEIEPEMQHVFQFLAGNAPEANTAIAHAGTHLKDRFAGAHSTRQSPRSHTSTENQFGYTEFNGSFKCLY